MKHILLFLVLSAFTFSACDKEINRQLLNAYISFEVNGKPVRITQSSAVNENTFECILRGDTALYINAAKVYEGVGFVVKAKKMADGTYTLADRSTGYYQNPDDFRRYTTNDKAEGTITIKKGVFQAKDMLNTLEGEFSFTAEDTLAKKSVMITKGSFKMERQEE